jgi:hypothetical protein
MDRPERELRRAEDIQGVRLNRRRAGHDHGAHSEFNR